MNFVSKFKQVSVKKFACLSPDLSERVCKFQRASLEFASEIHRGASFFSVRFSFERKAGEEFSFTLLFFRPTLSNMRNEFITISKTQTQKLGKILAKELRGRPASTRGENRSSTRGGEIICLSGDLGSGKTTFTQGLLKGLEIKGPYTSPTFNIVKEYKGQLTFNNKPLTKNTKKSSNVKGQKLNIYHIDAYRINSKDLLGLGFKDFAGQPNSIVIIEWAERVKKIIPKKALWIYFKWINDKERKIALK